MEYKFVSFNVLKMGESAIGQQAKKDWDFISRMIRDVNPDIVALQEVLKREPVAEFVRRLNGLGGSWDFRFEQKDTVRNKREGYAFIWNTQRIGLLTVDGVVKEPHIEAKWSRSLIRPPYIGRFVPVEIGALDIEFRLINTHVVFGEDVYSENHGNDLSDREMRKSEYRKLSRAVFPGVVNQHDGNFRVPYTFILGDYNLTHKDCILIDDEEPMRGMPMCSSQKDKSTISRKIANEDPTSWNAYVNDYDHVSCSNREDQYIQVASIIDGPARYGEQGGVPDFRRYVQTVSDHVPMVFTFDLKRPRSPFVSL